MGDRPLFDMKTFPVADGHCDFLYYAVNRGFTLKAPKPGQTISLPQMVRGGYVMQLFAAWTDAASSVPCHKQFLSMADAFDRETALAGMYEFRGRLCDGIGAVLTVEGGEAIDGDEGLLDVLRERRVRAMTLTWNHSNELAACAMNRIDTGLTRLGKRVVKRMDRLGIALDTAHLSDKGIRQAMELTTIPVFASHSNSRAVLRHRRSLPDELIRDIAGAGGVIGVNYYAPQLTYNKTACADDVARHAAHMAEVGGVECVCLGSDFDGMTAYPSDLNDASDVQNVAAALMRVGFGEADVESIMHANLIRYMTPLCERP